MPQIHGAQYGTFHLVTKIKEPNNWCTFEKVPQRLIHHLCMTRNMQQAKLHAFCILPDHIHLLLSSGPNGISKFMHAFKKDSARDIGRLFPAFVCKWQKNFYDERIRDGKQSSAVFGYIHGNAMKHGLVKEILDWPWTSLHFQEVIDPSDVWFN